MLPANIVPNLFHQKRTVSWHRSMPRSNSRSSTFRNDSRNRSYIITTRRTNSGDELKQREGLAGFGSGFTGHMRPLSAWGAGCHIGLTTPPGRLHPGRKFSVSYSWPCCRYPSCRRTWRLCPSYCLSSPHSSSENGIPLMTHVSSSWQHSCDFSSSPNVTLYGTASSLRHVTCSCAPMRKNPPPMQLRTRRQNLTTEPIDG